VLFAEEVLRFRGSLLPVVAVGSSRSGGTCEHVHSQQGSWLPAVGEQFNDARWQPELWFELVLASVLELAPRLVASSLVESSYSDPVSATACPHSVHSVRFGFGGGPPSACNNASLGF
jgi:hypothetical protein